MAKHRKFVIETEREDDGRWLAEIAELGVMSYGDTVDEARIKVEVLALRVVADLLEERPEWTSTVSFTSAS